MKAYLRLLLHVCFIAALALALNTLLGDRAVSDQKSWHDHFHICCNHYYPILLASRKKFNFACPLPCSFANLFDKTG